MWPNDLPASKEYFEEEARLAVLKTIGIDTLKGDPELQAVARFAALLCETPVSLVNVIGEADQHFLASFGAEEGKVDRKDNLCAYAMYRKGPVIIPNTLEHDDVQEYAVVQSDPKVRFYAGIPLVSAEGAPLGAVCVSDTKPRPDGLNPIQLEGLKMLATTAKRRLAAHRESLETIEAAKQREATMQLFADSIPDIAWSAGPGPSFRYFNARWEDVTGAPKPVDVDGWRAVIHPDDYEASLEKFGSAIQRASDFEDKWRLRQKDGSYRWVLSRAVPSGNDPATADWFGTITDIDEGHKLSESRDLLARELTHRIKNIFAVVSGLVSLRARSKPEVEGFADELIEAIRALGKAQDFVKPLGQVKSDNLAELLEALMAPYRGTDGARISVSGDDFAFGQSASTPLALIFHELATNSAKYGAFSEADGKISIRIDDRGDAIGIGWHESGGPPVSEPSEEGFGTRLVNMSLRHQLGGTIEHRWEKSGLQVDMSIPKEALDH